MPEGGWVRGPDNKDYLARVEKAKAVAKELNLTIIPAVYAIGYSGRYLGFDPNVAAGLPVRDEPFIVHGKMAQVDPSLAIDCSSLKPGPNGLIDDKLTGVRPFTLYRLSFVQTGEYKGDRDEMLRFSTRSGKRWVTRSNPSIRREDDKTIVETTFNTLDVENGEMRVQIMVACQDLKIEPVGALRLIRRELVPLKVTSEDGQTVYEEGKDFKPFVDPNLTPRGRGAGTRPRASSSGPATQAASQSRPVRQGQAIGMGPALELTDDSRIKDGQKLLVSFWHAYRMGGDQEQVSIEDPKVFEWMDSDVANCVKVWGTTGYFMNYDEIRMGGWENQPGGAHLKPGELLARHTKKGYEIIKKYAPDAQVYTWSDMYSPFHNAASLEQSKKYYYLVNGNWDGAWEGLPNDVIIMNWYSPKVDGIKFFADRGNQQVLCGYYDAGQEEQMKKNIGTWVKNAEGQNGVLGIMYTTWHRNFKDMKPYFNLLDTFDSWYTAPTSQASEKIPGATD
jgi:hypothetical protein